MHRSAHARCILSWDIRGGRDFAGVVGRGIRAIDRHYLNYTKEMSFAQNRDSSAGTCPPKNLVPSVCLVLHPTGGRANAALGRSATANATAKRWHVT